MKTRKAPVVRDLKFDLGRPANAYEMLAAVCQAITAEYKRYNQGQWISVIEGTHPDDDGKRFPGCGTIACVAGWETIIADGRRTAYRVLGTVTDGLPVRAADLLGFLYYKVGYGTPIWNEADQVRDLFSGSAVRGKAGTRAYARAGCRHIKRFMAKHKVRLLATTYVWKRGRITDIVLGPTHPRYEAPVYEALPPDAPAPTGYDGGTV